MKKGILIVSFGTSYEKTRRECIESIENRIDDSFKEYEIRRAFTSNMIIKKMKKEYGVHINTPLNALEEMCNEGFEKIIVQPLHVIPGFEYDKVKKAISIIKHKSKAEIVLGTPLLNEIDDYRNLYKAIECKLPKKEENKGVLLMGHGTEHFANACYSLFQRIIEEKRDDVLIVNVEGYPEMDDVLESIQKKYNEMTLRPLMIVAGDHAQNDMAGDEDSFKTILEDNGIKANCIVEGLGQNEKIQELFVNKIVSLIN